MRKWRKYCLFKYITTCTFTFEECCYQCDILYYIDGNGIKHTHLFSTTCTACVKTFCTDSLSTIVTVPKPSGCPVSMLRLIWHFWTGPNWWKYVNKVPSDVVTFKSCTNNSLQPSVVSFFFLYSFSESSEGSWCGRFIGLWDWESAKSTSTS